jgi:hypothetical protein
MCVMLSNAAATGKLNPNCGRLDRDTGKPFYDASDNPAVCNDLATVAVQVQSSKEVYTVSTRITFPSFDTVAILRCYFDLLDLSSYAVAVKAVANSAHHGTSSFFWQLFAGEAHTLQCST